MRCMGTTARRAKANPADCLPPIFRNFGYNVCFVPEIEASD